MSDNDNYYPGWDKHTTLLGKTLLWIASVWGLLILSTVIASGDLKRVLGVIAIVSYALPIGALLFTGIMLMGHNPQVLHSIKRNLWFSYATGLLGSVIFSFYGVIIISATGIGAASLTKYYWRLLEITIGANILFILSFPALAIRYNRYIAKVQNYIVKNKFGVCT